MSDPKQTVCRACGKTVTLIPVQIPVMRHQSWTVAGTGFGLNVQGYKCPCCSEVYR